MYKVFSLISSAVFLLGSLIAGFTSASGPGDAIVLAFLSMASAVAFLMFTIRPRGGHRWPPRCVPVTQRRVYEKSQYQYRKAA